MNATALLIVDVQQGLSEPTLGQRSNPAAESNMARLLALWRARQRPVIFIRHCSLEPNSPLRPELPGNAYNDAIKPLAQEREFTKTVNSAFIGTDLDKYLRNAGITALVVVGLTLEHCVSASVRSAADLGFDVILASDATAAFEKFGFDGVHYCAEAVHRINLVSLDHEFCRIRTTLQLLDEFN